MISRAHGLVLSALLGCATAAGAYAVIDTAHLGDAQTKPEVVSGREIAKRQRKLDTWQVSLENTLATRPPALPPLTRYPAVTYVAAPGAASLPTTAAPSRRTVAPAASARRNAHEQKAEPAAADVAGTGAAGWRKAPVAEPGREDTAPVDTRPPATTIPAAPLPTPSAPVASVAAAPASPAVGTPPAVTQPPTTLSVEQQCRALLRAAEGKSEQVKQEAERQCEALKQAAEQHR